MPASNGGNEVIKSIICYGMVPALILFMIVISSADPSDTNYQTNPVTTLQPAAPVTQPTPQPVEPVQQKQAATYTPPPKLNIQSVTVPDTDALNRQLEQSRRNNQATLDAANAAYAKNTPTPTYTCTYNNSGYTLRETCQ